MKKWLMLLLVIGCFSIDVNANDQQPVTLVKCVDGDTAHFMVNGKTETVRFLAIDAPEYTKEKEPFGKETSDRVCGLLSNASNITLEWEEKSDRRDRYDRLLAWVWVDRQLLQTILVEEGLAEVQYLYDDYRYNDELKLKEAKAKQAQLNIWGTYQIPIWKYVLYAIGIAGILWLLLKRKKGYKGKIRRIQKGLKKL